MPSIPGLSTIQEARHLAKKNVPKAIKRQAPIAKKTITPVPQHQSSDMINDIKRKHASATTNNATLASMKAKDPQGMTKYDNKRKFRSKTSVGLMDAKYQRGLYDHT